MFTVELDKREMTIICTALSARRRECEEQLAVAGFADVRYWSRQIQRVDDVADRLGQAKPPPTNRGVSRGEK